MQKFNFWAYHSFGNSLKLYHCSYMGCLPCEKYSKQCKTMPSGPPEFIPPCGMKCPYGKMSSTLTEISVGKLEISGTKPARPLIWTHRKFFKGFRGKARSRKPGQPGQPGSYEAQPASKLSMWVSEASNERAIRKRKEGNALDLDEKQTWKFSFPSRS